MDNEIDRKIDVIAILFLLVQNRQQTHDWTLIGSGTNGLGIQEWGIGLAVLTILDKLNEAQIQQTDKYVWIGIYPQI